MDVLVLIDKLDDLVHNAKPVPLTDQVRVDKEEIYDILDQMRATIPEEIKQARWIVKERQEMLAEAKREAERIVKEARERQERLISEEEITKQAERAAEDIIEDARGARAGDPARRRGLRRRDPQHARGQPVEVHRRRPARPRAAGGQGRARRSVVTGEAGSRRPIGQDRGARDRHHDARRRRDRQRGEHAVDARRRRRRRDLARRRAGRPAREPERAPIGLGEAVETTGGAMPCTWVIHAATMELGGPTSAEIIRRATASTLRCADQLGRASLALVAFGTGVGGFPVAQAARIEVEEVRRHLAAGSDLQRVVFAVRGEAAREAFEQALAG